MTDTTATLETSICIPGLHHPTLGRAVIYVIWCDLCEQVRVDHRGDVCVRCSGELEALVDPIRRPPNPPRKPPLVRLLNWFTGRQS